MCAPTTAPAEADTQDADRAEPDAPAHTPEWLVQLLTRLILFLLQALRVIRLCRSCALPAWWHDRPDLPAGSAQAEAASIRGQFGTAIAWMCRRHGIGPGHPEWPELSRAIVAFGGSLAGYRFDAPAWDRQWWDNPNIVPGTSTGFGAPVASAATLLLRHAVADRPPPAPNAMQAAIEHARWPASWLPVSGRHVFARAGPGPPPGRTLPGTANPFTPDERGQSMAGPAVLIRAA